MSFSSIITSQPLDSKSQEQNDSARSALEALDQRVEIRQKQADELKDLTDKISESQLAVKVLQERIEAGEKNLALLLDNSEKETEKQKKQHQEWVDIISGHKNTARNLSFFIEKNRKELDDLRVQKEEIEKEIIVIQLEFESLQKSIEEGIKTLSSIQASIDRKEKEKQKAKDERDYFQQEADTKKAALQSIQHNIIQAQDDEKKQIELTLKANQETEIAERTRFVKVQELKNIEELIASKTADFEEREGEISKKDSILTEKQNALRYAKSELEKFYGRELKSVII